MMNTHKENARKVIAILDGVNKMLDALLVKHIAAQEAENQKLKKAA